jgi:hypothetical protein
MSHISNIEVVGGFLEVRGMVAAGMTLYYITLESHRLPVPQNTIVHTFDFPKEMKGLLCKLRGSGLVTFYFDYTENANAKLLVKP